MFRVEKALELNRLRNKQTTASLVVAPAIAAKIAKPLVKTAAKVAKKGAKKTARTSFKMKKKAMLERVKKKAIEKGKELTISAPKQEKVEFGQLARMGYWALIALNIIGDLLDFAIIFGIFLAGATEIISFIYDACFLMWINIYFLGVNPKQRKSAGQKVLGKVLLRFAVIENVPIASIFYLRSVFVIKAYRQRVRAAEEGIPPQEI